MIRYLRFECPNRYREGSDTECRHSLAGPAIETLKAHSWDKPFIDTRFCPSCKCYYKITLRGLSAIPQFVMIDRDKKINWIAFDKVFPLVKIRGRRITRGK